MDVIMMMYNVMEELVERSLDTVLGKYDCCKCAKCRQDMTAVALNNLPPHYIVTEKGQIITRANHVLETQGQTNIIAKVVEAVEFIKDRPRHDA